MYRFIRWYNQNRKSFWITIGIIILIIGVIQLINYFYKVRGEEQLKNPSNQIQNTVSNYNYNHVEVDDSHSSLTGEKISEDQETEIGVIDNFINYCNEKDLQGAYDLLTDECKEVMYPTLEDFEQAYYNQVFGNSRKNITVDNWIDNIYKLDINEDFLSTGKYSKEDTIQDYITVEEIDNQYKLNINRYVGRKDIGKSKEDKNIRIEIEQTDIYMDYQIYKIKVTNNSENTILLDDGVDIEAMYIEDENGVQYTAYTHEINEGQLMVSPRETKELEIKYYSRYGSEKVIDKVVFSRMILNNETYTTFQNKSLYRDYANFEIEI